ncbi:polyketide cyclase [Streptomyces litmocidini]|uniref:SRPBCC family protein n=1 Tax=Streptomyces litmocidini TaxID=67318 RepID=UPI00167E9BD9|nr:SRPBCC family protein [Streptomyces litmocidini]GGV08984.1 polyketide cyclase [Streptomyces litmocidini]
MDRQWSLEESTVVDAPPAVVYRLVSDLRNMGRWSPECRSVWVLRPPVRTGSRFIGFNRRGPFLWPTVGRVARMSPDSEFVFDISVFGLPIARWGYRFEPEGAGTRLTEFWQDLRTDGYRARAADLLGTVFAGTNPARRVALNRAGMRTTLERIARTATAGA